jgi:hypothetical protein
MVKRICPNCHTFETCSVNPKMQNGHYPDYDCFIARKSNGISIRAVSVIMRKEVNDNVPIKSRFS